MKSDTFLDKLIETCFPCAFFFYGFLLFSGDALIFSILLLIYNLTTPHAVPIGLISDLPAIILINVELAIGLLLIFLISYGIRRATIQSVNTSMKEE
jgi:hypothetical protein